MGAAGVLGLAACGGGGGGDGGAAAPAPAPGPGGGTPAPGANPAPGETPGTVAGATFTLIAGQPNSVPNPFDQLNGTGAAAKLGVMRGLAVQSDGTMWVCDDNNHTIHRITPAGVVTTPYGKAKVTGATDGVGEAALFKDSDTISLDESSGAAILTVGQGAAGIVRTMNVTTLSATTSYGVQPGASVTLTDGPVTARSIIPTSLAAGKPEAGKSVVWVAEYDKLRKVTNGQVTTIASGSGVILDMVTNAAGELFVLLSEGLLASKIMKLIGSTLTLVAGGPIPAGANLDNADKDGSGVNAVITASATFALDKTTGNMFLNSNGGFRQITPLGVVTTLIPFLDMIEIGFVGATDPIVCVAPKRFITASQTQIHSFTLA